jgi:hypothetical protein
MLSKVTVKNHDLYRGGRMRPIPRLFLLLSLIIASFFASAQEIKPLAEFAPEDSFMTLSVSQQSSVFDSIDDDVNALEWQNTKDALGKLFEYLAQTSDDESLTMVWDSYAAMLSGDMAKANAQVLEFCPAYQDIMDRSKAYMDEKKFAPAEALLTVNASGLSPVPAVTALLRSSDPDITTLYTDMQSTLVACAQTSDDPATQVTTLDQDGTTLYVVGDGGDFPIIGGSVGDLFFISSNPDTARSIVRRANGSTEDNLTGSQLYQTVMGKLKPSENNVGLTLDFDALATLLESTAGAMTGDDPTADYALTRGVAMLRTLGGFAGHISATPEGLVSETMFATNPAGGDADLLKMINCTTCKVSSPFLAPDTATSVSSAYVPVRELIAYADSWVRGISEASGEPTTLKDVLSEAGVDIDTLLLNWIGSEAHTFVLKPFNTDAGDLLYGVPQVTVIPVSSPEAAQKGLDAMGETFWELYPLIFESGFSASDLAGFNAVLGQFAVRPYDYNGTTIHRIQSGFNGDLGYAFIGNYLVLGTPSKAIENLIDTYQGSRTILDNAAYQAARKRAPETVTTFAYSNDKPNFQGLADVFQLLSQPLAFAVNTALTTASSLGDYTFEPYSADLKDKTAETISAADGTLELTLPTNSTDDYGYLTHYYELSDLTPGTEVTLNVLSSDYNFYPSTLLVNIDDSMYIASGEYQDDGSYQLTFTPKEGKTYWLEVSGSAPGAFSPYDAVLADDTSAEPLAAPATLEVAVKPEDANADGYVITYYELTGINAGDTLEVVLSSNDYYPSISLIDTDSGQYVATSVYQEDGSYKLTYSAEEGKTYWLEVYGSLYEEAPASYTLEVSTSQETTTLADVPLTLTVSSEAAQDMSAEVTAVAPTFAELLDAADILPQLVRVLADHAATSESHSTIDGSTVYTHSTTFFRW